MSAAFPRMLAGLIAVACLLPPSGIRAASPDFSDPIYRGVRYNDDFSYLADKSRRTDGWDMFKYMPIADGKSGTARVSGRKIGTELSADLRWRIDRHLVLGVIFAEFFAGSAVQEALGKSMTYFATSVTYRV
jgi:hypothetical protein